MDVDSVIEQLRILIDEIIELHSHISDKWIVHARDNNVILFNQKSKKVSDAKNEIMTAIMEYDTFLTESEELRTLSERSSEGFIVNTRIKAQNSILEKKEDYCVYGVHKGKVSINKCFNDLFGARVIVDCDNLSYETVEKLCDSYDCLKIENKNFEMSESKDNYVAIHIYIKGRGKSEDINRVFRWELQIWTKRQESNNQEQHERHRFKYRRWELEVKRDV